MVWLLLFALIVYQILDIWQTYMIIKLGGIEINPIYMLGMEADGFAFIIKFKLIWILFLILGFLILRRKEKIKQEVITWKV